MKREEVSPGAVSGKRGKGEKAVARVLFIKCSMVEQASNVMIYV